MDIRKIQDLLQQEQLEGWLFTDFHGHDFIAKDFLSLTERSCTRRLFYFIPASGAPIKILSAIEPGIYTDKYGVRLEYDVHITPERKLKIYGPVQEEILII